MSVVIYHGFKFTFATLYPAYASYKAVKTKNVKDYVKWMMYWVVYAFFISVEFIADIFVTWIPFYYELKILFMLWLLSPTTKGSSIIYRKFIHPQLSKREMDIDGYIDKASDHGYSALLAICSRGLALATNVVLASAIKGQSKLVDHLNKAVAPGDLPTEGTGCQRSDSTTSDTDELENKILRECYQTEMAEKSNKEK